MFDGSERVAFWSANLSGKLIDSLVAGLSGFRGRGLEVWQSAGAVCGRSAIQMLPVVGCGEGVSSPLLEA